MFNQQETRKSEKPFLIGQRVLESGMGKYMPAIANNKRKDDLQ
jgi:hypothetical protein